jgi:uncharacterized membrane protein
MKFLKKIMPVRLRLFVDNLDQRLWVKPLIYCGWAIAFAFLSALADRYAIFKNVPDINKDTLETLLTILASSMLAVATFSVNVLVQAYNSVSQTGTPRAFSIVVSDEQAKQALSRFIAAFIFSVVALIAIKVSYYGQSGRFFIFILTVFLFLIVVLTLVFWIDYIARLGRMNTIIDFVYKAAKKTLLERKKQPTFNALSAKSDLQTHQGYSVFAQYIGYVQTVSVEQIQNLAEDYDTQIVITVLPGQFVSPEREIAKILHTNNLDQDELNKLAQRIQNNFGIGSRRSIREDPRFGFIMLSEIAARALSPGVNDPGTAIEIIVHCVKLIALWAKRDESCESETSDYKRVYISELVMDDIFEDAFSSIERDGAGIIEVAMRLQKGFYDLALTDNADVKRVAKKHAERALKLASAKLPLEEQIQQLEKLNEKVQKA